MRIGGDKTQIERRKIKFLLFPRILRDRNGNLDFRWLEFAVILQSRECLGIWFYIDIPYWKNIRFLD